MSPKFDLLGSHNWVKYWRRIKTHYQSRVLVESNLLVFPLSSTTLSIETRGGRITPPLSRVTPLRHEKGRARARINDTESDYHRKRTDTTGKSFNPFNFLFTQWYVFRFAVGIARHSERPIRPL